MSYRPTSKTNKTGSVVFTPPTGYTWLVQQIAVTSTSLTSTIAKVMVGGRFVCGTSSGNQDSADGNPIPVPTGGTVTITWSKGSAGTQYQATIYVTETPV